MYLVESIKHFLNDLVDKSEPYSVYGYLFSFLADHHFLYYPNLDSYRRSLEPSSWRKWIYYLKFVDVYIMTITSALLIINHDQEIQKELGIYLFAIFDQQKVMFAILFAFSLLTLFAKLIVYYFEIKHRNSIFDFLDNVLSGHPLYRLTQRNQYKVIMVANLLYCFWLELCSNAKSIHKY